MGRQGNVLQMCHVSGSYVSVSHVRRSAASRRFSSLLLSHAPALVLCVRCAAFSCIGTLTPSFIANKKRHGFFNPRPGRRGRRRSGDDRAAWLGPACRHPARAPSVSSHPRPVLSSWPTWWFSASSKRSALSEITRVLGPALCLDSAAHPCPALARPRRQCTGAAFGQPPAHVGGDGQQNHHATGLGLGEPAFVVLTK